MERGARGDQRLWPGGRLGPPRPDHLDCGRGRAVCATGRTSPTTLDEGGVCRVLRLSGSTRGTNAAEGARNSAALFLWPLRVMPRGEAHGVLVFASFPREPVPAHYSGLRDR